MSFFSKFKLTTFKDTNQKFGLFDVIFVVIIFSMGFWIAFNGMSQYRKSGGEYIQFYQVSFAPAVSIACGKGFITYAGAEELIDEKTLTPLKNPIQEPSLAPLYDFLNLKRDTFNCSELPNDILINKNPPQKVWYYLISTVGQLWKITGISWAAVDLLAGFLFAISIAFCYGIFRLGMNRLIAIPFTLLLCGSSLQLSYLPWLRDYCKAPFLLAIIFLLGFLVTHPIRNKWFFTLVGLCGLIIGIGYGFRSDILIALPPAILTCLFFIPGRFLESLPRRITAAIIIPSVFYVVALPILSANLTSGSCAFDSIIEGLMPQFSSTLNVALSPVYEIGHQYSDLYTYAMIGTHADHFLGLDLNQNLNAITPHCTYCSRAYDSAGYSLYKHILLFSPADTIIRGFAAAKQILNLGFCTSHHIVLPTPNHFLTELYQTSRTLFSYFNNFGVLLTLLSVFLIGIVHLRIAIFLILIVMYFSFYPMIQFHSRHYFHLEIISLWMVGFLVGQLLHFYKTKTLFSHSKKIIIFRCARSGLMIASFGIICISVLQIARYNQVNNVQKIVDDYQKFDKRLLSKSISETENGNSIINLDLWDKNNPNQGYSKGKMLLIEFGGSLCKANNVELAMEYDYVVPKGYHFDKKDNIPIISPENTLVYTPVFDSRYFRLKGITVPTEKLGCVGNIYQITGDIDRSPIWLYLKLTPDWREKLLYQTLKK